ncbi:three component ABC system middle component [Paraburkholderia tropica]|uniref:three component ABC system middle component n=1 Tax=Paraburkholderia tropica TaxID=92647 RepID=UPI001591D194|nr:three component ABC system middle component [Paraburkholderia tropica]
MAGYVDRSLFHNSALACFLLASFSKEYRARADSATHPGFEKLLLVLPITWHGPSRRIISKKNFATPLQPVLAEEPRIIAGLKERVAAHAAVSAQGLNIACSTGLLVRREESGEQVFAFGHQHWPRNSSPTGISSEMTGTVHRLANWFRDYSAADLFALFGLH